MISDKGLICVLAVVRGNPELEARRDKLVVRTILCLSHPQTSFPFFYLLGACVGDIWTGPCAHCSYSFLDINPLSKGHALVIPKCSVVSILSPLDVGVLNGWAVSMRL
jgi:diadenosine tetraphosphate (Ap4A) HIT family hydrolase